MYVYKINFFTNYLLRNSLNFIIMIYISTIADMKHQLKVDKLKSIYIGNLYKYMVDIIFSTLI